MAGQVLYIVIFVSEKNMYHKCCSNLKDQDFILDRPTVTSRTTSFPPVTFHAPYFKIFTLCASNFSIETLDSKKALDYLAREYQF